jgi:hypothetical protein
MNNGKPLQPLSHGNILIVGAKASNFDEEILTHPRIILWSSQQEHWTNKDLPQNVRAVFVTRWIGHNAFGKILAEARRKQITMFNPEGTGQIAKQVKELLNMTKPAEVVVEPPVNSVQIPKTAKKLHLLLPFIDWNKSNSDNARFLMSGKLSELGLTSTFLSLSNFIGIERKKRSGIPLKPYAPKTKTVDVSVQILDNMVKELQDMRDFLVATTEENKSLKMRIEKFKKVLDND